MQTQADSVSQSSIRISKLGIGMNARMKDANSSGGGKQQQYQDFETWNRHFGRDLYVHGNRYLLSFSNITGKRKILHVNVD